MVIINNNNIYIDLNAKKNMDKKSNRIYDKDGIPYMLKEEQEELERLYPDLFDEETDPEKMDRSDFIKL